MNRYSNLLHRLSLILFLAAQVYAQALLGYYDVLEFGASGDGTVYDTRAVQSAIDSASTGGGGVVYFPPGTYLCKTLILRDNITLHVERGARLLGSTELNTFDPSLGAFKDSGGRSFGTTLIFASEVSGISIRGDGIIDGQGYEKYYPKKEGLQRPSIIRFVRCNNVKVQNITLINSAAWVQHYVECKDLTIEGVTVRSYSNKNNDGLDIEGCQRVYIRGCNIDSEDDSIVLKTLGTSPCRDVVISDCIISGLKSAIKTGTESIGDFENISISNCSIYGTRGISLLTVDGGSLNNITISNISMRNSYAVIVMRLGNRMRPYSVPKIDRPKNAGECKNIMINNIQATGVTESNDFISGIPGHRIENVTLSNIRIEYAGGGKLEDYYRKIPEMTSNYPKAKMFGTLPSFGFFIRHASNVNLRNIHLFHRNEDFRPAIFCDQVEKLDINHLQAATDPESAPLLVFKNTNDVKITNSRPMNPGSDFIYVDSNSYNIKLIHNDLDNVQNKCITEPGTDVEDVIKIIE